ncbi:effector-associated domain EAD1-containing protein [Streptomyces sp. t39]|uniref:effector-associated domain EAD1-containing protein n=1 Tax=Streptomyces sp. t39 TaxID=1828156 RepID=UPI001650750E|nr:effector-associated domain EAD1-containing protein [Streptomyces sp. t39]
MVPLLDRTAFSLQDPESKVLLDALAGLYYAEARVRMLTDAAGLPPGEFAWGARAIDLWCDVLRWAAPRRRLRPLIEVVAAEPDSSAHPIFKDLVAQTAQPSAGRDDDPCAVPLIGYGRPRPFIDREELRGHLRVLLHRNGCRVLVVTGGTATGKTWTWHLISHVLESVSGRAPYLVDFSHWAGPPAGPADVMGEIADLLGWERFRVDARESEETQARNLLSKFKGLIRDLGDRWFVFDALDSPNLTEPARRLIEQMAVAAERRETGGGLRVVLLAYDRPLPPSVADTVLTEDLRPVRAEDLRAFFGRVAEGSGNSLPDEAVELLVASVLEEALGEHGDPSAPLPFTLVSRAAADRARLLLVPSGGSCE